VFIVCGGSRLLRGWHAQAWSSACSKLCLDCSASPNAEQQGCGRHDRN
jgi:hypothetical protein